MLQLLHTLYITESDSALHLEGQCLRILHSSGQEDQVPLHLLNSIVTFSHGSVSQNGMGACASKGIHLAGSAQSGIERLSFFKPVFYAKDCVIPVSVAFDSEIEIGNRSFYCFAEIAQ